MKKFYLLSKTLLVVVCLLVGASNAWGVNVVVPDPVYLQDFEEASTTQGEAGSNFGITGATLKGSGAIQTGDALFGQYYQNMPGATETTKNANFLTLTTNAFSTMQTASVKTVTISFWINAFNSTLSTDWGSIFVAYGETGNANHGYPYGFDVRNTLAVHTNVYRAFYHDNGSQNSSWLSKGATLAASWHHVAVVYTEDRTDAADVKLVIKQYVDGTLKQEFSLTNGWDGENIGNRAYSLLDDMGRLTEYCIGGNSSEAWKDLDNQYAYDEIAIYNVALTADQINQIKTNKLSRTVSGTQIGLKSNGSGYVTDGAMSDKVTLKPGESYHYNFINYNRGINNWNNYVVPVWGENGTRVITVRADNWEDMHHVGTTWGSNAGCTSNFNWTNYAGNMNGATVDMTVTFTTDKKFNMSASITPVDGSAWTYSYTNDYTDSPIDISGNSYIKVALAVSHSWLDLLSEGYSKVSAPITSTTGYATFSSTYPVNVDVEGLEAYKATAKNGDYITMEKVTGDIAANTGLVLKGTAGTIYSLPVKDSGETPSGNLLKPCDGSWTTLSKSNTGTNYVLSEQGDPKVAVFAPINKTNATLRAGVAYLYIEGGVVEARALRFSFGGITEIENVEAAAEATAKKNGAYLENGKIAIYKNGMKFNAAGAQMK